MTILALNNIKEILITICKGEDISSRKPAGDACLATLKGYLNIIKKIMKCLNFDDLESSRQFSD